MEKGKQVEGESGGEERDEGIVGSVGRMGEISTLSLKPT
jgi:hypothetical protein